MRKSHVFNQDQFRSTLKIRLTEELLRYFVAMKATYRDTHYDETGNFIIHKGSSHSLEDNKGTSLQQELSRLGLCSEELISRGISKDVLDQIVIEKAKESDTETEEKLTGQNHDESYNLISRVDSNALLYSYAALNAELTIAETAVIDKNYVASQGRIYSRKSPEGIIIVNRLSTRAFLLAVLACRGITIDVVDKVFKQELDKMKDAQK